MGTEFSFRILSKWACTVSHSPEGQWGVWDRAKCVSFQRSAPVCETSVCSWPSLCGHSQPEHVGARRTPSYQVEGETRCNKSPLSHGRAILWAEKTQVNCSIFWYAVYVVNNMPLYQKVFLSSRQLSILNILTILHIYVGSGIDEEFEPGIRVEGWTGRKGSQCIYK